MTDKIIFKRNYNDGNWEKYLLRKNGTIHYINSADGRSRIVTPDTLINIIRLKKWYGAYFLNIDALKKATGIPYI